MMLFIIGMLVGAVFSFFILAILNASRDDD